MEAAPPETAAPVYRAVAPLYVGYGVCLGLLQVTLPTVLQRSGLPIEQAGYLALLFLPFGLSALWAPLVDRFAPFGLDRRLGWVAACQAAVIASLLAIAFAGPARLDLLMPLLALLAVAAATMDVTLDGYLAETASREGRAMRGGLKVSCMYAGTILGATLALLFFERLGWQAVLVAAAGLCALALACFVMFFTPQQAGAVRDGAMFRSFLIERRMAGRTLLVVGLGAALGLGMAAPRLLMVARDVPFETIGLLFGPLAMIGGLGGAICGVAIGRRWGSAATLALGGTLFGLSASVMGAATDAVFASPQLAGTMIVACTVAYGAAYASICSLALGWVAREQAATDYAIVQSVWNTAIIAGGSLAGLALANAGSALFLLCAVGVMAAASLLARLPSPSTTGLRAI